MSSYDLLKDFSSTGVIQTTPAWVLAVIPFANQVTLDRSNLREKSSSSFSNNNRDSIAAGPILVLGPNECVSLDIASDKGSHTTGLTASLVPNSLSPDFLTTIHPGDWIMGWVVNDESIARDLMVRIKALARCNGFMDGFKFLGRVGNVRKNWSVAPEGTKRVAYTLSANGFTEFDSKILYYPELERQESVASGWIHKLAANLNDLVRGGNIDIQLILPKLITTLLGTGVTAIDSPDTAYLIPAQVANLLGHITSKQYIFTFADLLEVIMGVQSYPSINNSFKTFLPEVKNSGPLYTTSKGRMLGRFLPFAPAMNAVEVWSILQSFLNPAMNEMYNTLRVNRDGNVVPHFIVRQKPFTTAAGVNTTPAFDQGRAAPKTTSLLDLPRWLLDDSLMLSGTVGTSDAMRCNYVHLSGLAPGTQSDPARTFQLAPPMWDEEDIRRSGLRPFDMSINCSPAEIATGPKEWVRIATDFLVGLQLTYNGSFTVIGLQAPICVGDNLEHDGIVYHIERVVHSAGINPGGYRYFNTTIYVTYGMSNEATMGQNGVEQIDFTQYPPLANKAAAEVAVNTISAGN